MPDVESAFVFSSLFLVVSSTLTIIWFWANNRSTPGLLLLLLSCLLGTLGLLLALINSFENTKLKLLTEYALLFAGHGAIWLGVAVFWQRKTKLLTITVTGIGLGIYTLEALCILNGSEASDRVAIAAGYYALVGFGTFLITMKAKALNRTIYQTAFRQPQVGSSIIMLLLLLHGILNLFYFVHWMDFALVRSLGLGAVNISLQYMLAEALIFAPMLVLGTVIMVTERVQTELRIEKMVDPVTNALNRRAFIAVSKAVLARARRNTDAVSLIMVEVLNYTELRTQLGRPVTDSMIADIAHRIFGGRREQDIFSRFSNDEFLLLLPGTPEEGTGQVKARIAEALSEIVASTVQGDMKPNVSILHSTVRGDDLDIEGMIDRVGKVLNTNRLRRAMPAV